MVMGGVSAYWLGDWQCRVRSAKKLNERRVGEVGSDLFGSLWGQVAESCEHGNEPSSSINWEEFLNYLRLLKKDCFM